MDSKKSSLPLEIGAVIVLYFPSPILLRRLLNSLNGEVTKIFVVDNTPEIGLDWLSNHWFVSENLHISYLPLGENYGIAKAQNVGIEHAMQQGCTHVVLFDQDSAAPLGMINKLLLAEQFLLTKSLNVGSVGPLIWDEKTKECAKAIRFKGLRVEKIEISPASTEPVSSSSIIASGSLIRVDVLNKVGLMREDLFIDWVDIEWCMRASKLGFTHYIIPNAIMKHSIGDEFVTVGKKNIVLHSDVRNYYIVRNACHLLLSAEIDKKWRFYIFSRIPFWMILYTLTSKSKLKSFKILLRACFDGISGRLGKAF